LLAKPQLDTLIRRAQLSLEQIDDGRELGRGGAVEEVGHDLDGAEAATACLQPREERR